MPNIGRDHYVRYLDEDEIAAKALQWRRAGGKYLSAYFNIVSFVRVVLRDKLPEYLHIKFFTQRARGRPAYVTYNPLTLHIDRETWRLADIGEPMARYIVAHEIGHIVLHDHRAKAFSNDPAVKVNFAQDEQSAEWQANTFAAHFLLPTEIVLAFDCLERLLGCGAPAELTKARLISARTSRLCSTQYNGEPCSQCGDFSVVCNGNCKKCDTCGATTDYNHQP